MSRLTARVRSILTLGLYSRMGGMDNRLKKIEGDIAALRSFMRTREERAEERLKAALSSLVNTISLIPELNIKGVVPHFPHQGYEITGEEAAFLFHLIRRRRPKLILELGSGSSTVLFAAALRANGHGRMISVEHDSLHAKHTIELLEQAELTDRVELVLAPLVDITLDGRTFQWYDLGKPLRTFSDEIDLLFVDGPPGKVQTLSRYPALPMLLPHLSPTAIVVVDDGAREDEVRMVEMWRELDGVAFDSEALDFLPHAPVLLTLRESESRVAELRFAGSEERAAEPDPEDFSQERRSGTS